jgi:hypothetical protein
MTKSAILMLLLGGWVALATAQETSSRDEVQRRNAQINRHCSGIVQAKFDYAKLPSAEKASRDRSHSAEIEACYRSFAIVPDPVTP